jgi:hypothetical protein
MYLEAKALPVFLNTLGGFPPMNLLRLAAASVGRWMRFLAVCYITIAVSEY